MYKGRLGQFADHHHHRYAETDPTGRYARFEEVLGKGAMKTVYKAIDEVLGMEVAWNQVKLKDLLQSADDLQRLYSEVHLLRTLDHDSIIRFYTSWIDVDHRTFNFITEMFTSGTLREYRKKYKRVDIRAIKIWARQILAGLVYLHNHDPPVIHRDIKCDNIFVNGHLGQVKIGDLGLAAILRRSNTAHSVIGTPEFMAPELYEENYNELVDVYSFGMCVLEMFTSEYPYSECTNPAQIYKKVTSGKLPRAFYKIQDQEAQRFIGKCLETATKRLSAEELLLDPFLACDGDELLHAMKIGDQKPILNDDIGIEELQLSDDPPRTHMNITGKLNPEDDTIFLKVQLSDIEGSVRNVFFPFDILSDTPRDVASEMVKELDITDWEPFEIADMIDGAISALVPHWKRWDQTSQSDNCHILDYQEDDVGHHRPFYSCTSSSSSPVSRLGLITSPRTNEGARGCYWPHGEDHDFNTTAQQPTAKTQNSTRLCPGGSYSTGEAIARNCYKQCKVMLDSQRASTSKDKSEMDNRRLSRNRSLVDLRSQLLHRSIVDEVNKRRLFKTVGAVENIGFQAPIEVSSKVSRQGKGTSSARTRKERRV